MTTANASALPHTQTESFTILGIIVVGIVLWVSAQSATGDARHAINLFLIVLLVSMVLINWYKISPLIFKGG